LRRSLSKSVGQIGDYQIRKEDIRGTEKEGRKEEERKDGRGARKDERRKRREGRYGRKSAERKDGCAEGYWLEVGRITERTKATRTGRAPKRRMRL
jgi:hypothetical protein